MDRLPRAVRLRSPPTRADPGNPGDPIADDDSPAQRTLVAEHLARQRAAAYLDFFAPVTERFTAAIGRAVGRGQGRVLDVGAGRGHLSASLAERGWDAVALDPDRHFLRRAAGGVRTVCADATRLPIAAASMDAVAGAFVLPHLPDLATALRELRRVLRPGGRLVLANWTDPEHCAFTGLASSVLARHAGDRVLAILAESARRAEPSALSSALAAAGFGTVSIERLESAARIAGPQQWWKGMVAASTGYHALLQLETPATRRQVLADFVVAAERYRDPRHDGLTVPVTVLLLRAT